MKILYFKMKGLLQSWGEHSSWAIRDTASWPTKSGIVGMISAALGYGYEDPRIGELCSKLHIGIKSKDNCLNPPLIDFQTVDYTGLTVANGKKVAKDQSTITQHKYYLEDREFLIALSADEKTLNMIYDAMLDPVWVMHLGRACCTPCKPLIPEIDEFESIEDALVSIHLSDEDEVIQVESETGQVRSDVRLPEEGRVFGKRCVTIKKIKGKDKK